MKNDSASTTTKEEILNASMRLFYEKGYHQTSFQDICREAHVYRGTIYYYYKEKSELRHDALIEHFRRCFRLAKAYCEDEQGAVFLSHYIQWYKFLYDPNSRRFIVEYFEDEPVYQAEKGLSRCYALVSALAYRPFIDLHNIQSLSFASVYGYIGGMLRLVDSNPSPYSAEDLFYECLSAIVKLWELDPAIIKKIRSVVDPCIQRLPKDRIDLTSL